MADLNERCLEQLRQVSHPCTLQGRPFVKHAFLKTSITGVQRAWKIKDFSDLPFFFFFSSRFSSRAGIPLVKTSVCSAESFLSLNRNENAEGEPHVEHVGAGHLELTGLETLLVGTETAAFIRHSEQKQIVKKTSYLVFLNIHVLCRDLVSGSYSLSVWTSESVSKSLFLLLYSKQTLSFKDTVISKSYRSPGITQCLGHSPSCLAVGNKLDFYQGKLIQRQMANYMPRTRIPFLPSPLSTLPKNSAGALLCSCNFLPTSDSWNTPLRLLIRQPAVYMYVTWKLRNSEWFHLNADFKAEKGN